jgi:hypothetical protein
MATVILFLELLKTHDVKLNDLPHMLCDRKVMQISIFGDITSCNPVKVNQYFRYGIISQKIELFIPTAVRTSNTKGVI